MKQTLTLLLLLLSIPALACDESCLKAQASEKFPSYLSWQYCDDLAGDFMTTSQKSLQGYRNTRLQQKSKRGMRNTRGFIEKRREWLRECDNYLVKTKHGRIFGDNTTTTNIFSAMDSIVRELDSLAKGVTYTLEPGQDSTAIAGEKFDNLFQLVDNHKTLLQLKGQFVQRSR